MSIIGGSTGGNSSYNGQCPNNYLMTGFTARESNGNLSDIESIVCSKPGNLFNNDRKVIPIDTGEKEGTIVQLNCAQGMGVTQMIGKWADGKWIGYLKGRCSHVNKAEAKTATWGEGVNDPNSKTVGSSRLPPTTFLTGVSGAYDRYIDTAEFKEQDFRNAIDAITTDEGKMKACSGIYPAEYNSLSRTECDRLMSTKCLLPDFKNTPMCSCVNSSVINKLKEQDPAFPNCPHIYDVKCQTSGYKTQGMQAIDRCDYMNCSINVLNSVIAEGSDIKQSCVQGGNDEVNKYIDEMNAEDEIDPVLLWGGGFMILLLVFLMIFAAYKYSKKEGGCDITK
jgi:hypothetical protein